MTGALIQETPDGRHAMAICEDCMVSELDMPEEGRWSDAKPGGVLTQQCPVCGVPEGLTITTEMIEGHGLALCQSCRAQIRL